MGRPTATERGALAALEREGVLLVYPIANRPEPPSLWRALYPRSPMRWAWDEGADDRVVHLWHLRERLARSRAAVYAKWYQGRAVFFSRALFTAMLAALRPPSGREAPRANTLSRESRELLALLEEDSPRSTKALRREAGLTGRHNEALWTRSMRELWERLLIVGTGEVEDGAFPSLEVGATRLIFEDLWERAQGVDDAQRALLARALPASGAFGKQWLRTLRQAAADAAAGATHE